MTATHRQTAATMSVRCAGRPGASTASAGTRRTRTTTSTRRPRTHSQTWARTTTAGIPTESTAPGASPRTQRRSGTSATCPRPPTPALVTRCPCATPSASKVQMAKTTVASRTNPPQGLSAPAGETRTSPPLQSAASTAGITTAATQTARMRPGASPRAASISGRRVPSPRRASRARASSPARACTSTRAPPNATARRTPRTTEARSAAQRQAGCASAGTTSFPCRRSIIPKSTAFTTSAATVTARSARGASRPTRRRNGSTASCPRPSRAAPRHLRASRRARPCRRKRSGPWRSGSARRSSSR
mmetsp:Transcript_25932/g.59912  ORF Transcript_25932/g.59912 Transcript_25932/m.59912 type:complete len:304 (+) Transcript_25932:676-1587(+)